jgi:ATP-dependent helicase/nuclease subunit B
VTPVSSPTAVDGALEELSRELEKAKGGDPLAPVTVATPSEYSAVFVRRALGAGPGAGGRRGWANIRCTTVPSLLGLLGEPPLAARGLQPATPAVDLEVIRARAQATGGWLERFASHPAAVIELRRALTALRRCPPETLGAIGQGQGADLVQLLAAVRHDLHEGGFADAGDTATEALAMARRRPASVETIGPLVTWRLGPLPPVEIDFLRLLGARDVEEAYAPGQTALTELRACADPDEEARSAVRSVVASAETGIALWRQGLFHPPGLTYGRLLRQHLAGAGVAGHGPEPGRLARSMTGRALLGLLDLAGSDWPRHQVLGWLSSAPVSVRPGGPPVPATRWDLISADAGVVRGPRQWHERLGGVAARGGPDADEAAALATVVDVLYVRATPPRGSWPSFGTWALDLLDHYLLPGTGPSRWPEREEADARQVRTVIASLGELSRVSGGTDLSSFRIALRTELERTATDGSDGGEGGFGDGVFVAPYAAARGLRFESVVVTGLADALASGGDDVGLLGHDLSALDPSATLATPQSRREAARADLWSAVGSGSRERVGTLPRGDARTGRTQVPSRWLGLLVDADTRRDDVDSFAAGLDHNQPAVSAQEFVLRERYRFVAGGGRPSGALTAGDERLARGFDMVRRRTEPGFSRFEGFVGAGRVSAFDPGSPVSATRFETYAKCPRRYLFDRVLRVSERVRPEELWRIEPMRRGTLVHAILEEYVAERVAGAPRSFDRLLALATVRLDEAEAGGLVGKLLLWHLDRAAIIRDLTRFHAEEGDLEPIAAELSFGSGDGDDAPPVTVVLDDGRTVAFHGSIDRVDRTSSGQVMVSDYKTGRQGRLSDLTQDPVAAGKLLQLPLYALAAEAHFGGPRPLHARYWLLSGDRSAPCFHLVMTDAVETRFRQVVRQIADGVDSGCFPGVPGVTTNGRFGNCIGCDFDRVCPSTRDREWGRAYNSSALRGVVSLLNGDVPDELAGSVVKGFVDPDDGPEQ